MICLPCRDADHDKCDDKVVAVERKGKPTIFRKRKGRLYRSCVCQHKTNVVPETRLPG